MKPLGGPPEGTSNLPSAFGWQTMEARHVGPGPRRCSRFCRRKPYGFLDLCCHRPAHDFTKLEPVEEAATSLGSAPNLPLSPLCIKNAARVRRTQGFGRCV